MQVEDQPRRIVAAFDGAEEARHAIVALERRGIDANDIRLVGGPVPTEGAATRDADMVVVGEHGRRFGIGAVVGAVVFAGIAVGAVVLLGVEPRGLAIALAAVAAVPGFFVGGFWGVAAGQPVTDDAFDTYVAQSAGDEGPFEVEVLVEHGADPDQVEAAFRDLEARDIRRDA